MAILNNTKVALLNSLLSGETIKVGLLDTTANYTVDPDNDAFVADLPTGSEPTDASYGRQTLSGVSITQDNTNDRAQFDANDAVFSSLSTSNDIEAAFVYRQVGGDDTSPGDDELIAVFDDDSGDSGGISDLPKATNGSDFEIQFGSDGILELL